MRFVLLCFSFWMLPGAVFSAAPEIRSIRNAHFEVVGLHLRSVSYVSELSQTIRATAERYLEQEGLAFPLPILVTLRPEAYADFEGNYRIRTMARGAVEVDLRWLPTTSLKTTCRALSEALLVQYAFFNYGSDASRNLRAWPVTALTNEAYLSLRPAQIVSLFRRVRQSEVPQLKDILEPSLSAAKPFEGAFAYCLLATMKSGDLESSVVQRLFRQALAGADIEASLASALPGQEPTTEPMSVHEWWQAELKAFLAQEHSRFETMETSRTWLTALAALDTPLPIDSGKVEINLRSLWTHRKQAAVRDLVEARYDILRLRMLRVNPAYYNPARSLGLLFENLLSDAPSHQYIHSLVLYLSDWEDAKEMQANIENRLGKNSLDD